MSQFVPIFGCISFDGRRLFENILAYLFVFAKFHHVQAPNIFKALYFVSMKIFYKRKVFASVDMDLVSQRDKLVHNETQL